jgi:hypothetical protein
MKALAIVALSFAALSIFIPVMGVFLAILCSVLALIAFRSEPTLAGITLGINIINTAFLSPSIVISDVVSSGALDAAASTTANATQVGAIYWSYVASIWLCLRLHSLGDS